MTRALAFAMICSLAACGSTRQPSPYDPPTEAERNTVRAERLTREAADLIASDPEEAEVLLRDALAADLFHGPAHNNLGVLFLGRGQLYEAAQEFEWAKKVLPGHPDPRVNLALVMEAAGRVEDALESYDDALVAYPGYLPALQGAARLMVATSRQDDRLAVWLEEIGLRGESRQWRDWASREAAGRQ